jgi:hypothetical protein
MTWGAITPWSSCIADDYPTDFFEAKRSQPLLGDEQVGNLITIRGSISFLTASPTKRKDP